MGTGSGSVGFLVDFFFEGDSLVLSVADSLLGDFSVVASVFFVLLFFSLVLGLFSAVLGLFSAVLGVGLFSFLAFGLVALSAAGLLVVAGLFVVFVEGDAVVAGTGVGDGFVLTLALADGVMVAATDAVAAGVMVAPRLAVADCGPAIAPRNLPLRS